MVLVAEMHCGLQINTVVHPNISKSSAQVVHRAPMFLQVEIKPCPLKRQSSNSPFNCQMPKPPTPTGACEQLGCGTQRTESTFWYFIDKNRFT